MKWILFTVVVSLAMKNCAYALNCYSCLSCDTTSSSTTSLSCTGGTCLKVVAGGVTSRSCLPTGTCLPGTVAGVTTTCCSDSDNCNGDSASGGSGGQGGSTGLKCYSCTNCNDESSYISTSISCTGGSCMIGVVNGVTERSCVPAGVPCVDSSIPGFGSTTCCSDSDYCNGDTALDGSSDLKCYNCINCNYTSSSTTSISCPGGTCMKSVVGGVTARNCVPAGAPCVDSSIPGVGSTTCCKDRDYCNGDAASGGSGGSGGSTGLKCYSCVGCNDASSYSSTSISCPGGTCMKQFASGLTTRSCVPAGTPCGAASIPGVTTTYCSYDNCNDVDQMKVNVSAMIFLVLSSVFFYLFK